MCIKPFEGKLRLISCSIWIFSFAEWIKEQELPQEMKSYCKNVLNFLGHYHSQGIDPEDQQEEDDDQQDQEEEEEEDDEDDDEEEEEEDDI